MALALASCALPSSVETSSSSTPRTTISATATTVRPPASKTKVPAVTDTGTPSQANALRAARNYLEFAPFSRKGLIRQLSSSAGDGYSTADATWAVDHLGAEVSWKSQAVRSGENYLKMMPFSRAGLIRQLSSSAGDQYTVAEATFAAGYLGLK